ncbi:MAG: hypothetical protein ABW019_05365 [Chitinophagaceae bacterium]
MKKSLPLLALFFCAVACNNADKQEAGASENDVDAARNFIQAALKSDFRQARTYMLTDSVNEGWMVLAERVNEHQSAEEKKRLAAASINIHNVSRPVQDSVTIVIYSNSYKNNRDTLKVVKQHGNWLVDLDYLFTHDRDTVGHRIDTISR